MTSSLWKKNEGEEGGGGQWEVIRQEGKGEEGGRKKGRSATGSLGVRREVGRGGGGLLLIFEVWQGRGLPSTLLHLPSYYGLVAKEVWQLKQTCFCIGYIWLPQLGYELGTLVLAYLTVPTVPHHQI